MITNSKKVLEEVACPAYGYSYVDAIIFVILIWWITLLLKNIESCLSLFPTPREGRFCRKYYRPRSSPISRPSTTTFPTPVNLPSHTDPKPSTITTWRPLRRPRQSWFISTGSISMEETQVIWQSTSAMPSQELTFIRLTSSTAVSPLETVEAISDLLTIWCARASRSSTICYPSSRLLRRSSWWGRVSEGPLCSRWASCSPRDTAE